LEEDKVENNKQTMSHEEEAAEVVIDKVKRFKDSLGETIGKKIKSLNLNTLKVAMISSILLILNIKLR
jgi:hypothetical protein